MNLAYIFFEEMSFQSIIYFQLCVFNRIIISLITFTILKCSVTMFLSKFTLFLNLINCTSSKLMHIFLMHTIMLLIRFQSRLLYIKYIHSLIYVLESVTWTTSNPIDSSQQFFIGSSVCTTFIRRTQESFYYEYISFLTNSYIIVFLYYFLSQFLYLTHIFGYSCLFFFLKFSKKLWLHYRISTSIEF